MHFVRRCLSRHLNRIPLLAGFCASLPILLAVPPAVSGEPPQLIYGNATMTGIAFGYAVEPVSDLVQLRLNATLVASAAQGAAFEVYAPILANGVEILHVRRGSVVVIDERGAAAAVSAGSRLSYPVTAMRAAQPDDAEKSSISGTATLAASTPIEDAYRQWQLQEGRQGFLLSDSVMTRQQEYLSSLKIDIVDLNRAVASFIRRLLF